MHSNMRNSAFPRALPAYQCVTAESSLGSTGWSNYRLYIMGEGHGHEAINYVIEETDVSLIVSVLGFASSTGATMKRH